MEKIYLGIRDLDKTGHLSLDNNSDMALMGLTILEELGQGVFLLVPLMGFTMFSSDDGFWSFPLFRLSFLVKWELQVFCDDFGSISIFGFSGILMNVNDEDENDRKKMKVEIEKDQRVHFL
ncbi:hypothetical protein MTR_7g114950 [Medicago truncatula]|uniref:Uncharacterized protein n=1 Tax=Medicago truncatula TaxID=3880 RepID=G7L1V0_MEDTR|nr:hypothetical protein MTR_7g114950 [Medicago truncatula]